MAVLLAQLFNWIVASREGRPHLHEVVLLFAEQLLTLRVDVCSDWRAAIEGADIHPARFSHNQALHVASVSVDLEHKGL